jgi:hypothetical protein
METEPGRLHLAVVGIVWIVAAFGTGAAIAWFYRRLYRSLSFYYLWALWTVIVSLVAAAVFVLGLV